MAHLTPAEKAVHIAIAEDSFEDVCDILVWSGGSDEFTDNVDYWNTTISGIPCGFDYAKAYQAETGQVVILEDEAKLRISLTQDIDIRDKVETRNKIFSVDGITEGVTCKVVFLKSLEVNQ